MNETLGSTNVVARTISNKAKISSIFACANAVLVIALFIGALRLYSDEELSGYQNSYYVHNYLVIKSILCIGPVFSGIMSIIGVIIGYMAKVDIKQSKGLFRGNKLATWGIVLSYLGIAVFLGYCFMMFLGFGGD
jgi:hypothetical protein